MVRLLPLRLATQFYCVISNLATDSYASEY